MKEILAELSKHPVATMLSLTGPIVVARDIAHAKLKERLDRGEGLPPYFKDHPVYYAGPAKTPEGLPSGSFGPTTAGRMDSYVDLFQSHGGSMVMIAKGNRSAQVTEACKRRGGFYLGSAGGPAALLAKDHIRKVELVEYPSSAWRRSTSSRSWTSRPSSSWTTRATTSTSSSRARGEDAMIEPLRRAFNASWTERAYEAYKERLSELAGSAIGFRLCESPVFLPPGLRDEMVGGALEIWDQLLQPAALERSKVAVPPAFDVPENDEHPLFAQADFAVVEAAAGSRPASSSCRASPRSTPSSSSRAACASRWFPGRGSRSSSS